MDNWLEISLDEHNLGRTQNQLQQLYDEQLTPIQRQLFDLRRTGNTIQAIAQELKIKPHQAMGEWTKVYLAVQSMRV